MSSSNNAPPFIAPELSFTLHPPQTTSCGRRGTLVFTGEHNKTISTPALISFARRGAVPHLTRDNVARLPIEMTHLALEQFLEARPPPYLDAPFSLHRFVGLHANKSQDQQIITMGLRDVSDTGPDLLVVEGSLPVMTFRGVVKVTSDEFLSWTIPRPPDILFAPSDDPCGITMGPKRLRKSLNRSLDWANSISKGANKATNVFCSLVGGHSIPHRQEFVESLLERCDDQIAGYVLNLRTAYSPSSPLESAIPSLLNTSLSRLPPSKPRILLSANGPHEILRSIRDVGIDLFVDDWASYCSSVGVALDFTFPVPGDQPTPPEAGDLGHNLFDPSFERAFVPLSSSPLAATPTTTYGSFTFPHPFGPAAPTQAYVHHLLQSHEMTAHVILALHNQTLMHSFLGAIRDLLDRDSPDAFAHEVDRFFAFYSEGDAFAGGLEYECLKSAKEDCNQVDLVRGKGSLKEKRKEEAEEEARVSMQVDPDDG